MTNKQHLIMLETLTHNNNDSEREQERERERDSQKERERNRESFVSDHTPGSAQAAASQCLKIRKMGCVWLNISPYLCTAKISPENTYAGKRRKWHREKLGCDDNWFYRVVATRLRHGQFLRRTGPVPLSMRRSTHQKPTQAWDAQRVQRNDEVMAEEFLAQRLNYVGRSWNFWLLCQTKEAVWAQVAVAKP